MSDAEMAQVHRQNLERLMINDIQRVDDLAVHLQTETVRRARSRSGTIPSSMVLAEALAQTSPDTRINAIWGDCDVIAGDYIEERRHYFEALPNSGSFQLVEGAGHWVMYEQPAAFENVLVTAVNDGPGPYATRLSQ